MRTRLFYLPSPLAICLSWALLGLLGWTKPVAGQTLYPANLPDNYYAQGRAYSNVQNTGMGMCSDQERTLHVMTWDGSKPSFGWAMNNQPQQVQLLEAVKQEFEVRDPDIIAYHSASDEWFMMAVYQARNNPGDPFAIYQEVQRYEPSTDSWQIYWPVTRVSTYSVCEATNPNLDIDYRTGEAVFVFEQGGSIQAGVFNIQTAAYGGLHTIACNVATTQQTCKGGPSSATVYSSHRQPDVSIWSDRYGVYGQVFGVPDVVSFTYVTQVTTNGQSTLQVDLQQFEMPTLQTSPDCSLSAQMVFGPVPATDVLELPRIAAIDAAQLAVHSHDCTIAVRHADDDGNHIYSICRYWDSGSNQIATNVQQQNIPSLTSEDRLPVPAYSQDYLILVWQAKTNSDEDIVARQLSWTGYAVSPDLEQVNLQIKGAQLVPCMETRNYMGGGLTEYGYVGWYDQPLLDTASKLFNSPNMTFRQGASGPLAPPVTEVSAHSGNELAVLPNPAKPGAHLRVQVAGGERVRSLTVLEAGTGRTVATLPTTALAASEAADVALPTLTEGLYIMRLVTDQGTSYLRFSYQP